MNSEEASNLRLVLRPEKLFIPSISVECVIFGFQAKTLKVLLNKVVGIDKWMLPGGFVKEHEDTDEAAFQVLYERTGLFDVFLKQFYFFGKKERNIDMDHFSEIFGMYGVDENAKKWYSQRFVTLGYYSLIKHEDMILSNNAEQSVWFNLDDLPPMIADHSEIISVALGTLRQQVGHVPIGHELLPEKFTMPELRSIYEAILGRELDRRNFQRKMLSIGLITPLNEVRKEGAHKSPNLYTFNTEIYDKAIREGIQLMTFTM